MDKDETIKKFKKLITQSLYNDRERDLIANTFADNEDLIMAIRKHFLQGELSDSETLLLNSVVKNESLFALLRKTFLPEIDPEAPLGQAIDLWVSIDTKDKLVEDAYLDMKARLIVINYLEQQFYRMTEDKDIGDIELKDLIFNKDKDSETSFVDIIARNTILSHIDGLLNNLRRLAIQIRLELTPEEMSEKLKVDSNK